jgi:hypothetical protein
MLNDMKIGDTLVFTGVDVVDKHFENFNYGQHYKIIDISPIYDEADYGPHCVILFENTKYGCLRIYVDKYFIKLSLFRDEAIGKVLK